MPTLANLAIRKEKRERPVFASSWLAKKTTKATTTATLIPAVTPKAATVVTVVTVVIVVIITLPYLPIRRIVSQKNTSVNRLAQKYTFGSRK